MGKDRRRIILTRDIASATADADRPLVIRHPSYPKPDVGGVHITLPEAEENLRAHLPGRRSIVFVGLNKSKTPSSRTRNIWEVLFYELSEMDRWSIDTTLFVSRPWRAWFHFGLVGARYREFTYSYLAESQWNGWRDAIRVEDPFAPAELVKWGEGLISSDYDRFHSAVNYDQVPVGDEAHAGYHDEKSAAFGEERTIAAILRRLSKYAESVCPSRKIPTRASLFAKSVVNIVATDLPIDAFLVRELQSMILSVDTVGEAFNVG